MPSPRSCSRTPSCAWQFLAMTKGEIRSLPRGSRTLARPHIACRPLQALRSRLFLLLLGGRTPSRAPYSMRGIAPFPMAARASQPALRLLIRSNVRRPPRFASFELDRSNASGALLVYPTLLGPSKLTYRPPFSKLPCHLISKELSSSIWPRSKFGDMNGYQQIIS